MFALTVLPWFLYVYHASGQIFLIGRVSTQLSMFQKYTSGKYLLLLLAFGAFLALLILLGALTGGGCCLC